MSRNGWLCWSGKKIKHMEGILQSFQHIRELKAVGIHLRPRRMSSMIDISFKSDTNPPSTCEETRDQISSEEPLSYSAWMDDLVPLLIGKQKPWYMRTPQSVIKIRLISLDECHRITNKFKECFQEPKRNLNS